MKTIAAILTMILAAPVTQVQQDCPDGYCPAPVVSTVVFERPAVVLPRVTRSVTPAVQAFETVKPTVQMVEKKVMVPVTVMEERTIQEPVMTYSTQVEYRPVEMETVTFTRNRLFTGRLRGALRGGFANMRQRRCQRLCR